VGGVRRAEKTVNEGLVGGTTKRRLDRAVSEKTQTAEKKGRNLDIQRKRKRRTRREEPLEEKKPCPEAQNSRQHNLRAETGDVTTI